MSLGSVLRGKLGVQWLTSAPDILIINDEFMKSQYGNPLFFKNSLGFATLDQGLLDTVGDIIDFASSEDDDIVPYPSEQKALELFDPLSYLSFEALTRSGYVDWAAFPDHLEFYLGN